MSPSPKSFVSSSFSDKLVVVTGGSGGLGGAVVDAFLKAGAQVIALSYRLPDGGNAESSERLHWRELDCSSEEAVQGFYGALEAEFQKPLWASIHLVGGFSMSGIKACSLDELQRMHRLNTVTSFLCSREAAKVMAEGGRIVNVAARPALEPAAMLSAYAMSKAAVVALTQVMAKELLEEQILVNAIVPSVIDTPLNREAMPKAKHELWPKPEELAEAILWLSSVENSLTTGTLLPVYGRA